MVYRSLGLLSWAPLLGHMRARRQRLRRRSCGRCCSSPQPPHAMAAWRPAARLVRSPVPLRIIRLPRSAARPSVETACGTLDADAGSVRLARFDSSLEAGRIVAGDPPLWEGVQRTRLSHL